MKIELKHLAPYLPYGLKGAFYTYGIHEVTGINVNRNITEYDDNVDVVCRKSIFKEVVCDIDNFKPLLLPLSERKPFFDKYLSNFWSNFDYYVECIEDGSLPYADVVQLLSEHFDVFGLIDAGLALNKNDYK